MLISEHQTGKSSPDSGYRSRDIASIDIEAQPGIDFFQRRKKYIDKACMWELGS